jgi:repressor LexA
MDTMELDEIVEGLKKPGKSKKGLAEALDRQPSAVTALLHGEREIKAREVPIIRAYLELDGERTVPLVGFVGAGAGRTTTTASRTSSIASPPPTA